MKRLPIQLKQRGLTTPKMPSVQALGVVPVKTKHVDATDRLEASAAPSAAISEKSEEEPVPFDSEDRDIQFLPDGEVIRRLSCTHERPSLKIPIHHGSNIY
mmetsp:Transcript_138024/g.385030  ORF Transcript_138024/g.385030 Transcript_138024/m.385030 type:complete len:101 (-) Transcript_138024:267-569(-)